MLLKYAKYFYTLIPLFILFPLNFIFPILLWTNLSFYITFLKYTKYFYTLTPLFILFPLNFIFPILLWTETLLKHSRTNTNTACSEHFSKILWYSKLLPPLCLLTQILWFTQHTYCNQPCVSYFFFMFFFSFIFISWRLITLQYCSGFCHTLIWISHGFTCIPHPDSPPSHFALHPIPLGLPSAPGPILLFCCNQCKGKDRA